MKQKRSVFLILVFVLLLGAGIAGTFFLFQPFQLPEKLAPEPAVVEEEKTIRVPEPPPVIPIPPRPPPEAAVVINELHAPDGFPKHHAGFVLEEHAEREVIAGVSSYFIARYLGEDEEEVSVRFLALQKKTSEQFLSHMVEALTLSGAVKMIAKVELSQGSGWSEAALYTREEAGILLLSNTDALAVISAPSPDVARLFGSSLKFSKD